MKDLLFILAIGFLLYKIFDLEKKLTPVQGYPALGGRQAYNEETWEWVDYKGRKRQITVHRRVTFL